MLCHGILIRLNLEPVQTSIASRNNLHIVLVHAVRIVEHADLAIQWTANSRERVSEREGIHGVGNVEVVEGEGEQLEQTLEAVLEAVLLHALVRHDVEAARVPVQQQVPVDLAAALLGALLLLRLVQRLEVALRDASAMEAPALAVVGGLHLLTGVAALVRVTRAVAVPALRSSLQHRLPHRLEVKEVSARKVLDVLLGPHPLARPLPPRLSHSRPTLVQLVLVHLMHGVWLRSAHLVHCINREPRTGDIGETQIEGGFDNPTLSSIHEHVVDNRMLIVEVDLGEEKSKHHRQ